MNPRIILASASPRRKQLLEQLGLEFEIIPATGDEVITKTAPADIVKELSSQKALQIAANGKDVLVIGADTIVTYQDKIMGKPKDTLDAKKMLTLLQGQTHKVYTGVTVVNLLHDQPEITSFAVATDVTFYPLSEKEMEDYIATGDPMDKAGAYGIQGLFAKHVKEIHGDYNNIVGLPIAELYQRALKNIL